MKKNILSVMLMLVLSVFLFSDDFLVGYVDGNAERLVNSKDWAAIEIGDKLTDKDIVKVSPNSTVEISNKQYKFNLTKQGTYNIAGLINSSNSYSKTNVSNLISKKINKMFSSDSADGSSVMGVRGDVQTQEIEWASDETDALLKEGDYLVSQKKYDEAVKVYSEALPSLTNKEKDEINFNIAYIYSLQGQSIDSINILNSIKSNKENSFHNNFVILKAKILVETFAFNDAIVWLESKENKLDPSLPEDTQTALLLKGIAYKETGNTNKAKASLNEVIKINADSEPAEIAKLLSEEIK